MTKKSCDVHAACARRRERRLGLWYGWQRTHKPPHIASGKAQCQASDTYPASCTYHVHIAYTRLPCRWYDRAATQLSRHSRRSCCYCTLSSASRHLSLYTILHSRKQLIRQTLCRICPTISPGWQPAWWWSIAWYADDILLLSASVTVTGLYNECFSCVIMYDPNWVLFSMLRNHISVQEML